MAAVEDLIEELLGGAPEPVRRDAAAWIETARAKPAAEVERLLVEESRNQREAFDLSAAAVERAIGE